MKIRFWLAAAVLFGTSILAASAEEREAYNRRRAEADAAAFKALDRNGDGRLTREEVQGDLDLGPRFNDIDINRDGVITPEELRRYIEQTYGIRLAG
jgi:Ca2+-binding EF-hand superfamily protein